MAHTYEEEALRVMVARYSAAASVVRASAAAASLWRAGEEKMLHARERQRGSEARICVVSVSASGVSNCLCYARRGVTANVATLSYEESGDGVAR